MRARGIDPGETIGWCDLERETPGVFRYIAGGDCPSSDIKRGGLALPGGRLERIDAVSIETPAEMHPNDVAAAVSAARGKGGSPFAASPAAGAGRIVQTVRCLLTTARIAERVACLVADEGVRIVEPTAAQCRKAIGVKFGAQRGKGEKLSPDQQIAKLVPLYIRGWPARSNVHVRDAGVAAFFALACPEDLAVLGIAA